ncbi:MAG: sigma-54-dependent Fis family transcriptional regulator [Bacteriovoracaceae bacterium]|nr:sigma-54-dependent Fis family transcriptional regulator [Bacteriovoracaceae bacterium]
MSEATVLSPELERLSSILFASLDEKFFFSEVCKHFHNKIVKSDLTQVYLIHSDMTAELVSVDGKRSKKSSIIEKGSGPVGHVIRTKKAYFSNSVERDPLFHIEKENGVKSALIVPVSHEGIVIAAIQFNGIESELEYSRDHITEVISILNQIKKPLANMKMYLAAKFLNETLIKQIESKEKELEESKKGLQISDTFKIEDKEIIGKSDSMRSLLDLVEKVSKSSANALIEGESGTGKEMVARKIHCHSSHSDQSFASVDCSSMSEIQLESELFGEETHDFSRGPVVKNGLIELANNGTLFINNIEKMPLSIQTKLIQFLNEGLAFRMNGQVPYRSTVRIMAATTRRLSEDVESNLFREDLYYSLNTVTLRVPGLSERKEDIEVLANHFLNKDKVSCDHKTLSPCVISKLLEYSWPGNVRELQNVMERAYILADGMIVHKDHLADSISNCEEKVEEEEEVNVSFSELTLDALERLHITRTLDHLGGNKTKTAKTLGITVKTLYNKLHSYGMIAPKEA